MKFRSGLQSDKMRQDAELKSLGLATEENGRWQEVLVVIVAVLGLGMFITSYLDLPSIIWKLSGFIWFAVGLALGLKIRVKLLAKRARRAAETNRSAAKAREQETQRQLAEMRQRNKETENSVDGVKNV